MPRVLRPRWGDLVTWGLWLMVALVMLLSPWRMSVSTPTAQPALLPPSSPLVEHLDLWRSPDDLPWFSPGLRARWQLAWQQVRLWWQALRAWGMLLLRLWSCRTLAEVIQVLTRRYVVRYLGALPVLYLLLEQLQARTIINRYCPTESPVDHGTVALVLVLNRLIAPRPLYRVMDWLASTVLQDYLGVPASKFNDDRIGRTLDALAQHAQAIWQDIASQALLRYHIDLSVLFYDLTALVMTGEYPDSELVDYGFAHNTPSDKQKIKLGVVATRDGGVPLLFQPWAGRTADRATVQKNMAALRALLERQGCDTQRVLIVGDSANLNSELALAYADQHLKYLAGLPLLEKVHRTLVLTPTERELYRLPLTDEHGPTGYWGWECEVPFEHGGRRVVHRGLVVLSGPMRTSLRRQRAEDFRAVFVALRQVQAKIGQKRYRSVTEVQRRAETQLRHSRVGKLVRLEVTATSEGTPTLRWWIDRDALAAAMRADGRYLLVTNDPSLTPSRRLALYRDKDILEKRFRVCKQDLRMRPLFVHSDERLRAMLLINMIALLAYSLLERQARQQGLCLTAQRILEQLSNLQMIEVEAWDGSRTQQLSEITVEQCRLLNVLWQGCQRIRSPLSPVSVPEALLLERAGVLDPRVCLGSPPLEGGMR
jgi:transposase